MALDQIDVDEYQNEEKNMSFLKHLDELRGHLFRSVIAIVALFIIAFIFPNIIFEEILFGPLSADFPTYKLLCFVSQKVHSVAYVNQAEVKIHVVGYENQADLKVFKVAYGNQAKGNDGLWYFVDYANQADKKVYFVDYANQSDLKIYFVKYRNQAGWRNKTKKHLLY